jgi:hypothetical protein
MDEARRLRMLPETLYMSEPFWDLAGDTTIMVVGLELDLYAGYTVYGGDSDDDGDFDVFLISDGRLLLAPTIEELIAVLPPAGVHSFTGDARFTEFCDKVKQIPLFVPEAEPNARLVRFDFVGTLSAIREREVFFAPWSGMAVDCINAALDLGRQFGEHSLGYQLARYGPLDVLYEVLWERLPEDQLDVV